MSDSKQNNKLSPLEIKLSEMVKKHIRENGLSLDKIRTGRQVSDIPIGGRSLFHLVKQRESISLKLQIKLIEFFGLKWELKIKKK